MNDSYGNDSTIVILLSHEEIKDICEDLEVSDNGIYAIMMNQNTYDVGLIFYCDNPTQAENLENEFIDLPKNNSYFEYNATIEKMYTNVFVGCESVLEEIKK